jgi:hypothetical protein
MLLSRSARLAVEGRIPFLKTMPTRIGVGIRPGITVSETVTAMVAVVAQIKIFAER